MTGWEVASEVARAVYGGGLLVLGGAFLYALARFGPPALRVLADLSTAIKLASGALTASTVSQESVARLALKIDEIHAAIVPPPKGSP